MSFDDLPEEQVDHVLRYVLCDRERQGDGETPRSWLQVPAVRLVCAQLHAAAVAAACGQDTSNLGMASPVARRNQRRSRA